VLGCDVCGSHVLVKVYADEPTGVSFRACWRKRHRRNARQALVRRAAVMKRRRTD
jgi:hypothetical protein